METYRLRSKLVENKKEFVIQTINNSNEGEILSTVYANQEETEKVSCPYPESMSQEDLLSLVKSTHEEKKKELELLLDNYRRVIAGNDPELLHHLGVAFYYRRLYREAEELFQKAVSLNPDHHRAYNYLGMTYLALNRIVEGIESCTVAVQKCPGYADYRNNLGELLLANRSCRQAISEFEEAIRINLYYGDAYLNLGLARVLNAIIENDPNSLPGVVRVATDNFKKASLIYADYDTAAFTQGLEALQRADLRRAFSIFHRLREDKKEKHRREFASFYVKFAMHPDWITEEVVNERIRFLESEIKKNPSYIDLYAELGHCLLQRAKFSWQRGVEKFRKAAELNPSLSKAQCSLDEAEREYDNICAALRKISEQS
ncbi:MAG: tetratricopeptide repeat protein [Candidatus Zixiibacteriota bacterium]